ncbi:hypothetical protein DICSQDRAFT_47689 [Dichomitus squalens LYAD-421 SS1]|uniref:uncharacterized protein n=1 Tax=Dichomitus squalens (strain LYAD-421) TaxID=732165 RepID=UPI00044152B9|nr:uncharacterized protein DICSQDRAFT_47689 [Dichomitus squalens LYAD-421 SS1]EJF67044.1 hypothetical protein DICSQDRAFT_47689 [Dichomitus squalens LYAD-421 SS1]
MSLAKSWFDHAFRDRAATEQLLRPDLESGLLSQHDYQLAVDFLPGYHRYLPYIHTTLWGALAGLATFRYRSRVRFPTTVVTVSAVSGYGIGLWHYFRFHRQFARELEDRQAFLLVLENVNKRLGNQSTLFPQLDERKMFETIMKRKQENGEVLSDGAELLADADPPTDGVAPSDAIRASPAKDAPARPKSTWEAIREANAQNAGKHSSWDELRQRHERRRVSDSGRESIEDPRAQAQKEFDAILEAERKAARG